MTLHSVIFKERIFNNTNKRKYNIEIKFKIMLYGTERKHYKEENER